MARHPLSSDAGLKDAARTTLRELLSVSKRYKRRRERLDALFLFAERRRKNKGAKNAIGPKATVVWDDPPEMELLLTHRDAYERLGKLFDTAAVALEAAAKADPDCKLLISLTFHVNKLEAQRERHLEAMTEILGQLSREMMAQENVLAKVVTEGAKLTQEAFINSERMATIRDTRGAGEDTKASSELQKIASELKQRMADGELFVVKEAKDVSEDA